MLRRFDHIDQRVRSLEEAGPFYRELFSALGLTREVAIPGWLQAEGAEAPVTDFFGIMESPTHLPNETRIAFWAESPAAVDQIAQRLRAAGAQHMEGPAYEAPDYYAAFFEDPSGNRLEVCYRSSPPGRVSAPLVADLAPGVEIIQADLSNPFHAAAVLDLVDAYSRDPLGGGEPLSDFARRELIPGLCRHPTTVILLAYQDSVPVGVAVCFLGFSTFAAKPLLNIHDLAVLPAARGQGFGRSLLEGAAEAARRLGCCKLTLEVLEHNTRARQVYTAAGFAQAVYAPELGGSLFFVRSLSGT